MIHPNANASGRQKIDGIISVRSETAFGGRAQKKCGWLSPSSCVLAPCLELCDALVPVGDGRGDKNYDTQDFVTTTRQMRITPHVAQNNTNRSSAIDGRTTRHAGYQISQQKRKRVEQSFGWMKMIGLLKKVKLRGLAKVSWWFTFVGAAYNLVRLRRLRAEAVA